jgi:two-component system chemotaxis sensor kinase CheA
VVRQSVKELGGRITIESEPGKGTAFTLTLPLTLAISDGMIVVVGDQTLVIPLVSVVECLKPSAHEVRGLGSGQQMLNTRGKFIPIVPVCQTIGAGSCLLSAEHGVLIVVETEATGQTALLVDSISDQRQFVIKSLGARYGSSGCTFGATILGDGRVALVLDVEGLISGGTASRRLQDAA